MAEQEQLVKKKGKTNSAVWKYFGFKKSDVEQNKVQCRICYTVVSAPHANTTNLFNHLKCNHKVQYDQAITHNKKQTKVMPPRLHPPHHHSHRLRTHFTVQRPKRRARRDTEILQGFKQLVNTLDKRYAMPFRHYFSRSALPALYDKCRGEVERDVAASADYFATTTDLWSSRTMEPYISLTIHYIDADFNLKTKCLQTAFFLKTTRGKTSPMD
ncbi:hypothetical protein F7725_017561 [Dissostichus mawsoni]|uniref:BED-type domain-containing protein n=1 Tax=Dissostichus mawsoni TaxID=36200 RepID=A0A7J5Z924_DISMA|nr:hypothetical protein F7725_017561 [Dissostichus mawsoni]